MGNHIVSQIEDVTPYGLLSEDHKGLLSRDPMSDWPVGLDFKEFFESQVKIFANRLWPEFDRHTGNWKGDSRGEAVQAASREIQLMQDILQDGGAIHGKIDSATGVSAMLKKQDMLWHYRVEDGYIDETFDDLKKASSGSGANFACYHPQIQSEIFAKEFSDPTPKKATGLFDFKPRFCRPRPYQMAQYLGQYDFKYYVASTHRHKGFHPSFISGHCLLGILRGCAVYENWLVRGKLSNELSDALSQFIVDYGDRRVFGGVHYPTDSIGSWVLALNLIDIIYDHPIEVREFALKSIRMSRIYGLIVDHFKDFPELQGAKELLDQYTTQQIS